MLTEQECREIENHILRLDPERKRIFVDVDEEDGSWGIKIAGGAYLHPRTFLDLAKEL